MNFFQPLDAIISGYAYESATTSLGVLEEGAQTKKWISAEMLCTLDNFIKVLLFSERIFVEGCAGENEGYAEPRNAIFGASENAKELFDAEGIFHSLPPFKGETKTIYSRIADVLKPVSATETPWFTVECSYASEQPLMIRQEMVTMDAFFIEYAIEQCGVHRFKPVFPGEHLYLGLRYSRVNTLGATHTIADIAGRRLRTLVREKMQRLNDLVFLGAPPIPTLPPIFVSRILHDCPNGSDIIQTLIEVRKSPAMIRFRKWAAKCMELIASEDVDKRAKALAAYDKLMNFSLDEDISGKDFSKGILNIIKDSLKGDVLGIASEVISPVMTYLCGFNLSVLHQFGGEKADIRNIDTFLKASFGDKFTRSEMDYVSTLLWLPDNLTDWKKENVQLVTMSERLDPLAPNLARPCFITTENPNDILNAQKAFEDLWKKGKRL